MTQFDAHVAKLRTKLLLSCSAAILLSACGGNVDPGSEQLAATAATVTTDAGAPAPANIDTPAPAAEAIAEAAPAAADAEGAASTASTSGASGQTPDATAQAFELTGYGSTPLQAQAGQQDANAMAPAPIKR